MSSKANHHHIATSIPPGDRLHAERDLARRDGVSFDAAVSTSGMFPSLSWCSSMIDLVAATATGRSAGIGFPVGLPSSSLTQSPPTSSALLQQQQQHHHMLPFVPDIPTSSLPYVDRFQMQTNVSSAGVRALQSAVWNSSLVGPTPPPIYADRCGNVIGATHPMTMPSSLPLSSTVDRVRTRLVELHSLICVYLLFFSMN